MISRKTVQITGIALTVIGLSVFAISYNQGVTNQNTYSALGCAVNATPKACGTTNSEIIGGFIGMIFGFFTALFGASLVVPSELSKMIRRVKGTHTEGV